MKTTIYKLVRYFINVTIILCAVYPLLSFVNSFENTNRYLDKGKYTRSTIMNVPALMNSNDTGNFMLGMIHNGFEDSTKYYYLTDSLLCNIWHVYGIWTRGPGWIFCDKLNATFSEYGKYIDMHFPHFDGQIEKRNFIEKGIQYYGLKMSLSNL